MLAYETEALATETEAETKAFSVETEAKTKTFSLKAEARPSRGTTMRLESASRLRRQDRGHIPDSDKFSHKFTHSFFVCRLSFVSRCRRVISARAPQSDSQRLRRNGSIKSAGCGSCGQTARPSVAVGKAVSQRLTQYTSDYCLRVE